MDKKDTLEKARGENRDERKSQIEINSFRSGWIGVTIVMMILLGFRWYFNESASDLIIIFLAQQAA